MIAKTIAEHLLGAGVKPSFAFISPHCTEILYILILPLIIRE